MNKRLSTLPVSARPYDSGSVYERPAKTETYKGSNGQLHTREHKAVWLGSVRVNGTRRTVTAPTKTEAQRKVTDLVKRKHRSELPVGSRRTLEWLVTEFQKTKEHKAEATQFYYRHWSRDWIVPKLGTLTLFHLILSPGCDGASHDPSKFPCER